MNAREDDKRGRRALVRGKFVIPDPGSPGSTIPAGAVYVEGDRIVAVGDYATLRAQCPAAPLIGSGAEVVLPGLINAHDHGRGVSTAQAGMTDYTTDLWLTQFGIYPPADPYLSAANAAAHAIECGITTVLNSFYEAPLSTYEAALSAGLRAHEDAGLRSVWALSILDRSAVGNIYAGCLPDLPPDLAARARAALQNRPAVSPQDYFALCRSCQVEFATWPRRASILCGPVSAHWCSDDLLRRLVEFAGATGLGMQTHLLETPYQRRQAFREYGESMVAHLAQLGFLGPRLSCAHTIWASARDLDLLAEAGVSVIHCPGSNLRLSSGIAPLAAMRARGINVALGLDSNALNDDGDYWSELRLAAHLHQQPGAAELPPPAGSWFALATSAGASALGLSDQVGRLLPGMKADLILVDMQRIQSPYAAPADDPLPLLLARAGPRDVVSVMIDGCLVMQERKLLTLDKPAIAAALGRQIAAALEANPVRRPTLAQELLPSASALCRVAPAGLATPYYRFNSQEDL
jgi:cytosine/adenosine deaminase-related metal-dependent hydrolase